MNIEKKLHDIIGDDAGYIHTARSRNDQVVTDFKMWVRDSTQDLISKITKKFRSGIGTIGTLSIKTVALAQDLVEYNFERML